MFLRIFAPALRVNKVLALVHDKCFVGRIDRKAAVVAIAEHTRHFFVFFIKIIGGIVIFRARKISVRKNHSFSYPLNYPRKTSAAPTGIEPLPFRLTVLYHVFRNLSIDFRTFVCFPSKKTSPLLYKRLVFMVNSAFSGLRMPYNSYSKPRDRA